MVEVDPTQLGLEFGTGAAVGGLIGFTTKKIAKLIAIIVGAELALFKFLESRGILQVNWNRIGATFLEAGEGAEATAPPSWAMSILSTMSVGTGFTGGFYFGFRRG